jgi:hypothetical protein
LISKTGLPNLRRAYSFSSVLEVTVAIGYQDTVV